MKLEVEQLSKAYGDFQVLKDVSFDLSENEILGIIGANGSGKTTIFDAVTGYTTIDGGAVRFNGVDIKNLNPSEIANLGVSRSFQEVRMASELSIKENFLFSFVPPEEAGFLSCTRAYTGETLLSTDAAKFYIELLKKYSLWDNREEKVGRLSYGQQKLLSIVCCAATNAELILLDEPISGIAPHIMNSIITILKSLKTEGRSILIIEHDMAFQESLCDRFVFLHQGSILCQGSLDDIRGHPQVLESYM